MARDVVTTTNPEMGAASDVRGGGHRARRAGWPARLAALGLIVLLSAGCLVLPDGSVVRRDTVAGEPSLAWNDPDDGLTDSPIDLADVGYVEAEHFIAGNATAYDKVGTWLSDGRWQARPTTSESFASRILVRRPADPTAFNGVVLVEWLNTTSGRDLDAIFRPVHTELLGKGYAWVGVSAQKAGVDDLKQRDPDRYGGLRHPGDTYAYDVFTRAGRIVADPASPVLGGLRPRAVLAAGTSQSASWLLTYINAVHPLVEVYDGFQLLSHLGAALPIHAGASMPASPIVRTDVDVPVLDVQTETEVAVLGTHRNRQDDSPNFRLWEVAGSAHVAEYGRSLTWPSVPTAPGDPCTERINSAPTFAVGKAATAALARWATAGVAPPSAPRLELVDPSATDPVARDSYGNALGGIRYPHVEVPTARVDGLPNTALPDDPGQALPCLLSGRTIPLSDAQLGELYPRSAVYRARFEAATGRAVRDGFLLPEDAELLEAAAAASPPVDP